MPTTTNPQTSRHPLIELPPASTKELEALLKRVEAILDESYLGMRHAEIERIVEDARQILTTAQIRIETERESGPEEAQGLGIQHSQD